MTRDLTNGPPFKSIINFAFPILCGNLFQQAYNIVDSAIVGKFVGVEALAGVGATGSVNFLIVGFVLGLCSGFAIPIAHSYGSSDYASLRKYYTNAMMTVGVIAVIVTILTLIFIEPILILMQTPDEMFMYSKIYISTIFAGIPGIVLYNYLSCVLRSVGDSRTPVFFLIGSALLNVSLDLVFVIVFEMGVFGTGFATIISQTTAGILCLLLIRKKFPILATEKSDWKIELPKVKKLLSIGFPMGFQFSITAIGALFLQTSINALGAVYCASVTAGSKISIFAIQGLEALGVSMATYTSQNLGAKKPERVSIGVKQSIIAGCVYAVVVYILIVTTSDFLALAFVTADQVEIIGYIQDFAKVNGSLYVILAFLVILRNTIQGAGYSSLAMIGGGLEMVARIFVALVLVPMFGYTGVLCSNPTAWTLATIFLIPAYIYVIRKVKNEHKSQTMSSL